MRILKYGAIDYTRSVARIMPLHKKGAKNNFKNYRPILNLCVATKIFEKCVLKCIETLAGFQKGKKYSFSSSSSAT
jgi:hypothetical protein